MNFAHPLFGFAPPSMFSVSPRWITGVLAACELVAVFAIGMGVYLAYVGWTDTGGPRYIAASLIATVLMVQAFAIAKLYDFEAVTHPRLALGKVLRLCAMLFLTMVACAFFLKVSDGFSRVWVFAWCLTSLATLCAGRLWLSALVRRFAQAGHITRNVCIVGAGPQAERLLEALSRSEQPWNRVVAVFDDRRTRVANEVAGCQVSGGLEDLMTFARRNGIDELVVALPWSAGKRIRQIVDQLQPLPARIHLCPDFAGLEFVGSNYGHQLGVPLLDICDKPIDGWSYVVKTILDKAAAAAALVLLSPLFAAIALAIKLTSRGPVFFRQDRYGYNQRLISMLKFRTMFIEKQDNAAEELVTRDDPRVTPVGAFLRRSSLDELPQLVNVLRGEMSLVGPRPHALRAKAAGKLYEEAASNYTWRHKVKPGITGWAQVNGWRGETDTEEKLIKRVEHDLHYINNWSMVLDASILLRTLWTVVAGRNAY